MYVCIGYQMECFLLFSLAGHCDQQTPNSHMEERDSIYDTVVFHKLCTQYTPPFNWILDGNQCISPVPACNQLTVSSYILSLLNSQTETGPLLYMCSATWNWNNLLTQTCQHSVIIICTQYNRSVHISRDTYSTCMQGFIQGLSLRGGHDASML